MIELWKKITKADIRNTLVMVWTVCSFIIIFRLMSVVVPEANQKLLQFIAGMIFSKWVDIMNYYFGQSKTEVDKEKKETEKKEKDTE